MSWQLQIKPFEYKDGMKYKVIEITDFTLHTKSYRPTAVGKKLKSALARKKADRMYFPLENERIDGSTSTISFSAKNLISQDPELIRVIREEERKGYKVLIRVPKDGIPIVSGKDTEEFIHSKNGKRIFRGLDKEKRKE